MTSQDYLRIKAEKESLIQELEQEIYRARLEADNCKMPPHRRPAVARDIVKGAIIWYEREEQHGSDYWHVVEEVLHPGDAFKGYMADGCQYGLDGAFVETSDYNKEQLQMPETPLPKTDFSIDELNLLRQWFHSMQDCIPSCLEQCDYNLAQKIYDKL